MTGMRYFFGMIIAEPTYSRVLHVISNMRTTDVDEFLAVSFAGDRRALSASLLEKWGHDETAIVAMDDEGAEPIAVGAIVVGTPNVGTLMFFATPRFDEIALPLTRFIRQRLLPKYQSAGIHRIQCVSIADYHASHRWIKALGLKQEAVIPKLGKDGQDFIQFAWTSDDVLPPDNAA